MHTLKRRITVILISLLFVMSASGRSSKLVLSWKNPAYLSNKTFHRVLVLGLSDKTAIRADFEDKLAVQLRKSDFETIPGNTVLLRPEGTQFDLNYLKTQIREYRIDAVVVSRLVKVENTVTYVPGTRYAPPYPYYGTFYGYYGAVYPVVYSPGYLKEEKKVRIETNVYAISGTEGELVWTCITDTFNPTNTTKAIDRLVTLVAKQMLMEAVL